MSSCQNKYVNIWVLMWTQYVLKYQTSMQRTRTLKGNIADQEQKKVERLRVLRDKVPSILKLKP